MTLRTRIYSGLYDARIEQLLKRGFSFNKIKNVSGISDYAMEICKWHLYNKYNAWNRWDLVNKIKSNNFCK